MYLWGEVLAEKSQEVGFRDVGDSLFVGSVYVHSLCETLSSCSPMISAHGARLLRLAVTAASVLFIPGPGQKDMQFFQWKEKRPRHNHMMHLDSAAHGTYGPLHFHHDQHKSQHTLMSMGQQEQLIHWAGGGTILTNTTIFPQGFYFGQSNFTHLNSKLSFLINLKHSIETRLKKWFLRIPKILKEIIGN